MSLFELQRIWDVWPNIYHHQVLRDLFRLVPTPAVEPGRDGYVVDRVFVIPGHLFVTTTPKQTTPPDDASQHATTSDDSKQNKGSAQLYAFSRIPLREEPESCDDHMIPYLLPLSNRCRRVVNVIDFTNGSSQRVIVLQDCGVLSSFEYNSVKVLWELKEEITFASSSDSLIHDAVLHTPTLTLLFNESSAASHPHTGHSSRITTQSIDLPSDGKVCLGSPTTVLTNAPPLSLLAFEDGVCFLPTATPYPKGQTTPGDYLDSGQLLAAKLCKLWNLQLLATKYSLEGAFDTAKSHADENSPEDRESFLPHLHHELITLLREDSSLQNPALLVALLAEFPEYRQQLSDCVSTFLDHYHSNDSSNNDLLTPLNADIVPMLEEYLRLSKEFDSRLEELELSKEVSHSHDVRGEMCRLLKKTETATVSDGEVEASSRTLLRSLCEMDPDQALLGIRDFFAVESFQRAVEELGSSSWSSNRNWRDILATESAVRIQRSYMRATTNHIPLFEETCRLLYHAHPSELLPFVTFAQLARDYQAQGDSTFARKCRRSFFFHRALNALPMFVSPEATPTSREAIQARCELLLRSDFVNTHMSSLQLLISNKLWSDAITLVERLKDEEKCHSALFHCLLVSLAKGGVLHEHVDQVWELLPAKFNVFDFMGALKTAVSERGEGAVLLSEDSAQLKVSSIGAKLLVLLKQTNLDRVNT